MSDSVRPHEQQPTRLPCPWDSPGKNNGVGCHLFLQCMKMKSASEVPQSCPTVCDPMDCSLPGSSIHGIFQARVLEWGATAFSEYRLRTRQIKMIGQRKPARNALRVHCLSPLVCLSTRTVLFFLLINTYLVSLLFVFLKIIFYKAKGPGPCH